MISTLGPCLPIDLLEATGRHAGPLPWTGGIPAARAGQWLENKFPPWCHAVLEAWAAGAYEDLDVVVFSRGDDAVQRLYYYVCELQRRGLVAGPRPVIFDLAQIPRATSVSHTIAAVHRLANELAVDTAALEPAIAATNLLRRRGGGLAAPAAPVCLLLGTPPPHRLLHEAIGSAGYAAIGDTLGELWSALGPEVEQASGDPAAAIGRQVHGRPNARRDFRDHAAAAAEQARDLAAAAAVLWYTEEDEARIWHLPAVRQALTDAGVPVLALVRRHEDANDGAADEIRAFLEGIGA